MSHGLAFNHPKFHDNAGKVTSGLTPCVICGKGVDTGKANVNWVHVHEGGGTIVTEREAQQLNAQGRENEDMYFYPVGPECMRKHPELRDYVHSEPK